MVLKQALSIVSFLVMCWPALAGEFIVGFRGQNDVFDQKAFLEFARKRNLEPLMFSAHDMERASRVINSRDEAYELYGFSQGAWSVKQVLSLQHMKHGRMPKHVTTVGAHPSVDVDFSHWDVPFTNYFDDSGRKHRSPGTHIRVPHGQAMQHVNQLQR
jgi:hypothetical protein